MNPPPLRTGRVKLLRRFWGHTPDTRARVVKCRDGRFRILLPGCPRCVVFPADVGTLFDYV